MQSGHSSRSILVEAGLDSPQNSTSAGYFIDVYRQTGSQPRQTGLSASVRFSFAFFGILSAMGIFVNHDP
jgi:hypothetical protein